MTQEQLKKVIKLLNQATNEETAEALGLNTPLREPIDAASITRSLQQEWRKGVNWDNAIEILERRIQERSNR